MRASRKFFFEVIFGRSKIYPYEHLGGKISTNLCLISLKIEKLCRFHHQVEVAKKRGLTVSRKNKRGVIIGRTRKKRPTQVMVSSFHEIQSIQT